MKRVLVRKLPMNRIKHSKRLERSDGRGKLGFAPAQKQNKFGIAALENVNFKVLVKPNANKTEILGYDKKALKIAIKAPADKNKANLELIKFLSKQLKRKVRIKSGLTSKEKVVCVV